MMAVELVDQADIRGLHSGEHSLPITVEAKHRRVDIVTWCQQTKTLIGELLAHHGGILFRGFRMNGTGDGEYIAKIPAV